jgi:thymidylate kinase
MTNSHNYGRLFVFEGPDGSGKTTLSRAFLGHLQSEGFDCDYFSYPGQENSTVGKLVYDLHHDPRAVGIETLTPTSLQILHIAAHVDAIESKILPALREGRSVVLDRFWWSTWVYGKVAGVRPELLQTMIKLERMSWGKAVPTMTFLLQRRANGCDCPIEESLRLSAEYTAIAEHEAGHYPIFCIKNSGAIQETLAEIIRHSKQKGRSVKFRRVKAHSNSQTALPLSSNRGAQTIPFVFSSLSPAKPTIVFDTYWKFAAERQAIFFRRLAGKPSPWTSDPVLREYKFTNAYRASDRVSQYLIKNVIYKGDQTPDELFFRILLFKFFNKVATWELLTKELGHLSFADYSFQRYETILSRAIEAGTRIYSAAYIMPSGGASTVSRRKHHMHLKLLQQMMHDELPARLVDVPSMKGAFELLRSYQSIGDFLAYQFVTDLNYSPLLNFSEMDFVVPGPGARDGIRKCFAELGGLNESELIRVVVDRQQAEFERQGLTFHSLWGRPLQLIDCQNLFCEVDKYARVHHPDVAGITGRTRIKQKYRSNTEALSVWYPPKWGLNERIVSEARDVSSI